VAVEGRDLARAGCDPLALAGSADTLAELALLRGDLVTASAAARESRLAARDAGSVAIVLTHAMSAQVELARGKPTKALQTLRRVRRLADTMPDEGQAALRYLQTLADASAACGEWQDASEARARLHRARQRIWDGQRARADEQLLRRLHGEREDAVRFLSHDLRLALAAACGTASQLGADDAGNVTHDVAAQLRSSLSRAVEMTESFIAELQSRNVDESRFTAVDMAEVVSDASEHLRVAAASKGLATSIRIGERATRAGVWVRGSRQYLHRAVLNVLDNAARVTSRGARVSVTLNERDGYCCVAVRDSGPGFDRVALPDAARQVADPAGHGFGLRLVRTVIAEHHGVVRITNRPRRGAMVELMIPLSTEAPSLRRA
jgi:signal transduction histidine kinase